jgi:all-trans-retinol 13,14-reductase
MGDVGWDAIVIGSGLGGLSAAAWMANHGRRVLVLERLANFGGAATIYRHGSLTMEASLHETDGDTVFGPNSVFTRLGLANAVEPMRTDMFYEVRGGSLAGPVQVPHGLDNACDALKKALPFARVELETYFRELSSLYRTLRDLEELSIGRPSNLLRSLFSGRLLRLARAARSTLARRLDSIFGAHEAAKFAVGGPIAYFDDDPAELSFLLFVGIWSRYVESGSYYFRGGSRALTMALVQHIKEGGGEALRSCNVTSILLDARGGAAGVVYQDSDGSVHEAYAPIVFAGAAPSAVAAMLPDTLRAAFSRRFARYDPSISLFNVSLALSRPASDFGVAAYSTFIYPERMRRFSDWPHAAAAFAKDPPDVMPPYVIADYGRLDSGLRQPGDPYLVSLCGVDRLAWWGGLDEAAELARRRRWIEALVADVDRHYPGFAGAVTQSEIATARTMRSRLGTPSGEVYGFRPTPARLFARPPSTSTSIKGLWISSAYSISGGYSGSMYGGLMAAEAASRAPRFPFRLLRTSP